ncbi:MAG: disulfide oxidoreductase [Chloroflexales bacterium]|nr:disulfide oxidoreductase [Chloroflexales bacterium]
MSNVQDTVLLAEDAQPVVDRWSDRALGLLDVSCRPIALLAAWIATCGSLFFSEVMNFIPCELCWYQRILMYPLAIILAVGILRNDQKLYLYALPFSLFGGLVSLYHYLLIKTDLFPPPPCASGVPCTTAYVNWLGFINIPFMALIAFVIISIMMGHYALSVVDDEDEAELVSDSTAVAKPTAGMAERMLVVAIIASVIVSFAGLGMVI